jgi:hypothetical protein
VRRHRLDALDGHGREDQAGRSTTMGSTAGPKPAAISVVRCAYRHGSNCNEPAGHSENRLDKEPPNKFA